MAKTYIITQKGCTIHIDGQTFLFNHSHPNFTAAVEAMKAKDWDKIPGLVDIPTFVKKISDGKLEVRGDDIYLGDEKLPTSYVVRKLAGMSEADEGYAPLAKFIENLMQNPSQAAREELYQFLEACNLPLTPDGCFLAYKRVRADYTDCHTGKMDNRVGNIVWMSRHLVDPDRHRTCSQGLHVCSRSYLQHFGGARTIVCKVNPRDVVSVPADYNDSKMRVCRYEVVSEINERDGVKAEAKLDRLEAQPVAVSTRPVEKVFVPPTPPKSGFGGFIRRLFGLAS
jgi:hypothetical protein